MAAVVDCCLAWLRRNLGWSNSRQSWEERLAGLWLLGGAVWACWYASRLTLAQQVVLWGFLILALGLLLRRGWLKLFGPVLFYDLARTARRGRYVLLRYLYAFLLLLLLLWIWQVQRWTLGPTSGGEIPARDMPEFAQSFFATFLLVQLIATFLLTPGYTGGAVAEEKERRTLEFLLATDLRSREIVLSKLASRLANLALLLLTGLPILSLLQLLGGVDPELVLAGFAATGLSMLSLASLSILNSVLLKKPRDAIVVTYLGAAAYLALSGASWLLLIPKWGLANQALSWGSNPVTVADLVKGFNGGNLISAWVQMLEALQSGSHLGDILPDLLRQYAIFHGLAALVCSTWAVLRLRPVALKQAYSKVRPASLVIRLWGRPRVGNLPMLWKEIFAEAGLRLNWIGRLVLAILVLVSFLPAGFIVAEYVESRWSTRAYGYSRDSWEWLGAEMNIWVRVAGTAVACLTLLGVAVRASTSIGSERDRQTWDSLLTSPLDSNSILFAKGLGSMLSGRWAWLWLGLIWALGLVTGGLHPLAVPMLLVAWLIYAAFLSGIGSWFSAVSRTTLRATLYTLLSTAGIAAGHWLVWICCMPIALLGPGPGRELEWVAIFQAFGLTPPVTLGFLAFSWWEFQGRFVPREWTQMMASSMMGLFLYAVATLAVWLGTSGRFRALTGRTPLRRPERRGVSGSRRPKAAARPMSPSSWHDASMIEEWKNLPAVLPVEKDTPNVADATAAEAGEEGRQDSS